MQSTRTNYGHAEPLVPKHTVRRRRPHIAGPILHEAVHVEADQPIIVRVVFEGKALRGNKTGQ